MILDERPVVSNDAPLLGPALGLRQQLWVSFSFHSGKLQKKTLDQGEVENARCRLEEGRI